MSQVNGTLILVALFSISVSISALALVVAICARAIVNILGAIGLASAARNQRVFWSPDLPKSQEVMEK